MTDKPPAKSKRRRAAHGQGTITKRKDGRWQTMVEAGWVDGKRKRLYAYTKTQAEAVAALDDLKKRAKTYQHQTAEIKTVAQFLDHWLDTSVTRTRAPKTIETYRNAVSLHIAPSIGSKRLTALNRVDVQRMLDQVARKEGIGPRSVENVRAVFRTALNDAVKWGMIDSNPAEHTTIERVVQKDRTALTVEQAKALLQEVHDDRFEALYVLASIYGLRRGECLGLRWSDNDGRTREVRIRQQVIVVNNRPMITPLKTKASIRTLPLLDFVSEALERRQERQAEEKLLASSSWQEFGLVFASAVGTMYQPANLHKKWRQHLEHAGLPTVPFHSLRHTAASFLVALNVHPRLAMEILGHSNIRTTMEVYSHAQQSGMRAALESVENVLRKAEHAKS
ncbi:MAG: site-specific integrase [Chloroflexota bacterium]|nr:site-specific integrase [Chloroflexota bacterium]